MGRGNGFEKSRNEENIRENNNLSERVRKAGETLKNVIQKNAI